MTRRISLPITGATATECWSYDEPGEPACPLLTAEGCSRYVRLPDLAWGVRHPSCLEAEYQYIQKQRTVTLGDAVLTAFGFSGDPAYELEKLAHLVREKLGNDPAVDALFQLRDAVTAHEEDMLGYDCLATI